MSYGTDRVAEALRQHGIVIICAEYGMGKTTILSRTIMEYMAQGIPTDFVDCAGLSPEGTLAQMKEALQWSKRHKRRLPSGKPQTFVAFDNVGMGDECDVAEYVHALRKIVAMDSRVMIAALPEGELLCEQMSEAAHAWSCDLRVERPVDEARGRQYDDYVLGVPALATALRSSEVIQNGNVLSDPVYQEAFISVVEAAMRDAMMEEERLLRCAMFLLGSGTKEDLSQVLGNVDDSLWRLTARDALLFGVDTIKGAFRCIGSRTVDSLNVVYASFEMYLKPYPKIVREIASVLFSRGDVARGAVVSLMCTDDSERCVLELRWGTRMLDAGEVDVVADALDTARENGFTEARGYAESACMLWALKGGGDEEMPTCAEDDRWESTAAGLHARLSMWCRSLLRDTEHKNDTSTRLADSEDPIVQALVLHGRAVGLLVDGNIHEAYALLVGRTSNTSVSTISSGLLALDQAVCSMLQGIVPNAIEVADVERFQSLCRRAGLSHLLSLAEAVLAASALAGGRAYAEAKLEAPLQRASRMGDTLLYGLLLTASAISDMRIKAFTRSHVKLEQATRAFVEVQTPYLVNIARVLHIAVRCQLGERITKAHIDACKGSTKMLDMAVRLLAVSVTKKKPKRLALASNWGSTSCAREIHWLINVLANDCGNVSINVRNAMPVTWMNEQIRITSKMDEFIVGVLAAPDVGSSTKPAMHERVLFQEKPTGKARIEIHLLGRLEVYVEGELVPNSTFARRHAEALLVLLAAVPGYAVKRYAIMESIWPTYDYDSANKCVYSATSVLRDRLRAGLNDPNDVTLVISNKVQGTVELNQSVIETDVEQFERKARALLDKQVMDKEAVAFCREIEELYRGDLFVPPTDSMGIVEERSREMRELLADAMIAGSTAALNSGMRTLACRFARKAHDADTLREDALRALVKALCAAGRHVEAQRLYERFVGHVVDITRRPPSKRLRGEVEDLLGEFFKGSANHEVAREAKGDNQQLSFSFGD